MALDKYLAVAYFQQGVSNFLVGDFEEALVNFNDALKYLRGNTFINYEQLGLKFKLFSCEVLFNRGLCYIYLQQTEVGMNDLSYAVKEKVTPDHDVIDEAIREQAEVGITAQMIRSLSKTKQGYTVFSIPVGVVYRPNSAKVKNLKTKDYLGKARLIAAADQGNTFTGFAGSEKKKALATVDTSLDDRAPDSISFAASNLVNPNLQSRSRQQSEPPINRNMFPPTPPPDADQIRPPLLATATSPPTNPPTLTGHANSVRSPPPPRPEPLTLDPRPALNKELPRLGTIRTASEPRGPTRKYSSSARSQRSDHEGQQQPRRRLFMETTPHRPTSNGAEADIDEYPDELYEMYQSPPPGSSGGGGHTRSHSHTGGSSYRHRPASRPRNRSRSRNRPPRPPLISETEEDSTDSPLSDFEILNNASSHLSRPSPQSRHRTPSRSRYPLRPPPPQPELRTIRVKAHSGDDTRYIMLPATTSFPDFVDRVREKFGVRQRFKIKVRDEGDLITMGDVDDWEMCLAGVRKETVRVVGEGGEGDVGVVGGGGGGEMGKMECWVYEV